MIGLLIPRRIEWKKQNLLLPCHTFQCFQLWLSSCSFMDSNSLERVLVCSGVLSSPSIPGLGAAITCSDSQRHSLWKWEYNLSVCVQWFRKIHMCFCFRLSNENVSTSVKFFYCCARLWLSWSGCSSERGFDYMDRLPLQRYFLILKDFWVRDRVLFDGRKPGYHF